MKTSVFYRFLLLTLTIGVSVSFTPGPAPDVTGNWRMIAHRVDPPMDGINDIYTHFKDLYGGCREDMAVLLNPDGSLRMTPVKGCQNPLGNVIMKVASKFMPSGKASWTATGSKISLTDGKGQQRDYDLQVSGTTMTWAFDDTQKQTTTHHSIEFRRE